MEQLVNLVKTIYSDFMKGTNTVQRHHDNFGLNAFIRCYNCYTAGGSLVKMRPWLYDASMVFSAASGMGHGIYYDNPNLYMVKGNEMDYTVLSAYNANGKIGYAAKTNINYISVAPNYDNDYSFAKFFDASNNNLLFFQNGSTNNNLHYINTDTLAYTHIASSFLAGTKAVCVNQSVLFAGVDDKLYWSAVNDGTSFTSTNFLRMDGGSKIQDLFVMNEIVIAFCDRAIFTVKGNSTSTFEVKRFSDIGVGTKSRVDGAENECYYVDTNFNFRRISQNPHYYGIDSSQIISDGIISTTEKEVNLYPSGASNFQNAVLAFSKVVMKGDFVFFTCSYYKENLSTNMIQTFVYNRLEKTFTMLYVYYDTSLYPDAYQFIGTMAQTKNRQNILFQNSIIGLGSSVGIYQLTQVPDETLITQTNSVVNGNAISFYTGRIKLGSDNIKAIQRIYFDITTLGSVASPTINILIYNEEETLLCTMASLAIDKKEKWFVVPRDVVGRAFYIKFSSDYTGGMRVNKWGIQYIDKGIKSF